MAEADKPVESVLARVNYPSDLKGLSLKELAQLAQEVRRLIIDTVTRTGGHLAPSLGVVELTIALHYVFNAPKDQIVWDVGHQSYAHKILTGRKSVFHTLRQLGGISGFPRRSESPFDAFDTGHSSTSISAALGMARAWRIKGEKGRRAIAVIGDGSLTAGLAYEGLNQAGFLDEDIIVILNDNGMSIAPNVGALSRFISRALSGRTYQSLRKDFERLLKSVPAIGPDLAELARRVEESFKALVSPAMLFEAFRFNYLGPIDGHRLERLIEAFETVAAQTGPRLVHVLTVKGKGYEPAEANPTHYHGVGAIKPISERTRPSPPTYTEVFGQTMVELGEQIPELVAITAAMPEGTGLVPFSKRFPERFLDVGIAEQHAVTCAAGMATQGLRPVVAIYSTFMQRAFDQVVHDVCLGSLPVVFAMDRGGIVGEDGATHQWILDLSFMRCVPNLSLMAPADENELRHMLLTALERKAPVALRYPRGPGVGAELSGEPQVLAWGKGELRKEGKDVLIVGIGVGVQAAMEAAERLGAKGVDAAVVNARFVKPLDEELICDLAATCGRVVSVEENVASGGFGSAVLEALARRGVKADVKLVAIADKFVEHGTQAQLRRLYGVDGLAVEKAVEELMG